MVAGYVHSIFPGTTPGAIPALTRLARTNATKRPGRDPKGRRKKSLTEIASRTRPRVCPSVWRMAGEVGIWKKGDKAEVDMCGYRCSIEVWAMKTNSVPSSEDLSQASWVDGRKRARGCLVAGTESASPRRLIFYPSPD